MSETTLEKTVREEQEAYDEAQPAEPDDDVGTEDDGEDADGEDADGEDADGEDADGEDEATPTGRALFDASKYETEQLALPKVDGEGVDKIGAKFAGNVWLERGNENDVALLKNCKLGQTVTLMVECEVGPPVPGYTTNREGDLDSLALTRKFTVKHVYRPAAEEL